MAAADPQRTSPVPSTTFIADVAVLAEHRSSGKSTLRAALIAAGFETILDGADPAGGYADLLVAARAAISAKHLADYAYPSTTDGHRFSVIEAGGWLIAGAYIPGWQRMTSRKHDFWHYLLDEFEPHACETVQHLCA